MLVEITDDNFEEKVKSTDYPFVIIFSSPWCGVCKKVVPRIELVSEKYDKAKFGKVDISANTKKPAELQVLSIPSIIIFKGGEEKERIIGDISEQELIQRIDKVSL